MALKLESGKTVLATLHITGDSRGNYVLREGRTVEDKPYCFVSARAKITDDGKTQYHDLNVTPTLWDAVATEVKERDTVAFKCTVGKPRTDKNGNAIIAGKAADGTGGYQVFQLHADDIADFAPAKLLRGKSISSVDVLRKMAAVAHTAQPTTTTAGEVEPISADDVKNIPF